MSLKYYPRAARRLAALFLLTASAAPAGAALTLTVTPNQQVVRPNDLIHVEYVVTNTDASTRTNVVLTATYPGDVFATSDGEFDGSCPSTACETGETATWNLGSIVAGGSIVVDLPPRVSSTATAGTVITFDASVTDGVDTTPATAAATVETASVYTITLDEDRDPVVPNDTLTYRVHYGHRSDAGAVQNSTLSLQLPASVTFASASDGGSHSAGVVTWPLGFLLPGNYGWREVDVTVDSGTAAGTTLVATAEIESVTTPSEDAVAGAATPVASTRPLRLALSASPNPARAAELMLTQITVSNTDPFMRSAVTLSARFPRDVKQLFEAEFDGDCNSTACEGGERVFWAIGDLPAGGSKTVQIPTVLSNAPVGAKLIAFPVWVADAFGGQARRQATYVPNLATRYELTAAPNLHPVTAGQTIEYVVDFGFRGDAAGVANAQLTLDLPDGVSFVSASDGGSHANGAVTWPLGFLAPGAHDSRIAAVTVGAGEVSGELLEATAEITEVGVADRARANSQAAVASTQPLALAIEVNPDPARQGEQTNLRFTVTNQDAITRFGVDLTLRFPQHIIQYFNSQFGGACTSTACETGEEVKWSLGDIAAGGSVTVDMAPDIGNSVIDADLVNLFAFASDAQGAIVHRVATIAPQSDTRYDLALEQTYDPVTPGANQRYTVRFAQRDDAPSVIDTDLRLRLPAVVNFVSASDGGALNGDTVEWDLGFLNPGVNGVRTVETTISAAASLGDPLEASAQMFASGTPVEHADAQANSALVSARPLTLDVQASPDPGRPGELETLQMTVSNNDAITRFGVDLTMRFPESVQQLFNSYFEGACPSTACETAENVSWTLGDIPAGESVTVDLPPRIANLGTTGTLVGFFANATDALGVKSSSLQTLAVQDDSIYELAIAESSDPVGIGGQLTYTLTFAARDDAPATTSAALELELPADATFVSASGGGMLNGNVVEWPIGFLDPGEGGTRTATVSVAGPGEPGALRATAALYDALSPLESMAAEAVTAREASPPLSLMITATPEAAQAADVLDVQLAITNNTSLDRFGVRLNVRFPQLIKQLFENTFSGDCPSTACETAENVFWDIGTIAAGATAMVSMPPEVANAAIDGEIIEFFATAKDGDDGEARGMAAVRIGLPEPPDADDDGVPDASDNCILQSNSEQTDIDGDGFGNRCDADFDDSCFVDFVDLGVMKSMFFGSSPEVDLDGSGMIDFLDLGIMKALFFMTPGPSGVPNICQP